VILYHFVGGNNGERFAAEVKQYYSGPVFAGENLARYCLGAPQASGAAASSYIVPINAVAA
jgi:hypothetical protein